MAKKKKGASKKAVKEVVVVTSKVKTYIKGSGFMSSSDVIGALNDKVHALLDEAMKRTASNKRSTVRAADL